jgi:putative holliday junction resolvase
MAVFLGIDYGEKNLGLAVSSGPLAEPVKTIALTAAHEEINSLVKTYSVTALVIGLSEGQMAQKTRAFASEIGEVTHLPIYFQDETLSSYDTRVKMAKSGKSKKYRQQKIDHLVAAAILQDYLDSHDPHQESF